MENYITAYCRSRNIKFGTIKSGDEPRLLMCIPRHVFLETDVMPVLEVVLQDEDLKKILISLNGSLQVWRYLDVL